MDQDRGAGPQERAPPQVVGEGPHVVLAVDVEEVDGLCPAGSRPARVLLDRSHGRRDAGPLEVGPEPLPGRGATEEPTVDERVDGDHLAARGQRHPAEQHGRATLVTADLEQSGTRARRRGLVEQQPPLVAREPTRNGVRQGPGDLEVGGLGGGRLSGGHRRPAGCRRTSACWLHSRAAQYRVEGVSHRHHRGDRDPSSPPRAPTGRPARSLALVVAQGVAGSIARPLGRPGHVRVAGGDGVPAAPRPDDVRHQVRPDRRRPALPGARACRCGSRTRTSASCRTRRTATCSPRERSSCWARASGSPDWVVQRLWTGLLLVVAFEGARRLWLALRPEASPWTAWVAGVAFAASPRLLGLVGRAERRGAADGRAAVGGAARSCWPSKAGSGVRAGALLVGRGPAVHRRGQRRREPRGAAVAAVRGARHPRSPRAADAWSAGGWVPSRWRAPGGCCPCSSSGRYSPPFLDYIETSAAVVRPLGWTNVARGADHWVSFVFVGGDPWWPGSYELSTDALLIAVTGVVAAAGLWGLTRPTMPLQRPLLWSLLLGMLCLTVARSGPLESPCRSSSRSCSTGRCRCCATSTRSTRWCASLWPWGWPS